MVSIPAIVGSTVGGWVAAINTTIGLINAELSARPYKWANAAARTAQTGMVEGDIGDQADTEQRWRYSGSAWVNITTGLFPVIPTSVAGTGTTLGASGKVIATAATSISVNGCFTSTYDNYLIKVDLATSGAASLALVLRVAGTNDTTAYDTQRLTSLSATAGAANTLNAASVSVALSAGGAGRITGPIELYQPAIAVATIGTLTTLQTPNPMTTSAIYMTAGFQHRTLAAYDGFTLTPSAGTVTGTIRIYGFNNI